jgi:hypothetical protein
MSISIFRRWAEVKKYEQLSKKTEAKKMNKPTEEEALVG